MEERPDSAVAEGTQVVRRPGGDACAMNGAFVPSTSFFANFVRSFLLKDSDSSIAPPRGWGGGDDAATAARTGVHAPRRPVCRRRLSA